MRKKRFYLGLTAGVVLGGLLVLLFNREREREPEYEGKPLSYWVATNSVRFVPIRIPFNTETSDRAISTIGTNGLPYLLKWIRYETPPWKTKFYRAVNPILLRLNPAWKLDDNAQQARATGSMLAIRVLGPRAQIIVGELGKTLNDPKGLESAYRATLALSGIGTSGALPPLPAVP